MVVVHLRTARALKLVVVPPDTPTALAEELLSLACQEGNQQSAGQLLGLVGEHQGAIGRDIWDEASPF